MKSDITENISISAQSSIRIAGKRTIYFDPYQIPQECHDADFIFITHDHSDHFSPKDIRKVMKAESLFVIPKHMISRLQPLGIEEGNLISVVPGGSYEAADARFETVAAYNLLKPFHPKGKGWVGYVLTMDGLRYYIAGDTDATKEAKAVKCDVALIPIGGFFTMNAKSAAKLVNGIHPRVAIPTHYGCRVGKPEDAVRFQGYLDEPIIGNIKL